MKNDAKTPKIVVIGGGSGSSAVLQGLKRSTPKLSAVVTMFDSGGSSGLLQSEFGYPPLGDLRQCLLALSEDNETTRPLRELIGFRFLPESSLNGHSLGNLLLAALTTIGDDLERAIDEMARLLRVTGDVIPVALKRADLCAELEDGSIISDESSIDLRGKPSPRIERVFLNRPVAANPKAIKAILDADAVVLGPGDLYTSIIPNLLVKGIPGALAATKATRIYVCNLMTKLGETDGFKASDFVNELVCYLGGPHLDWAVINTRLLPESIREVYRLEAAQPVKADLELVQLYVPGVIAACLGNNQVPLKHNPDRIAEAVLSIIGSGRVPKAGAGGNGQPTPTPFIRRPAARGRAPKIDIV